MSFDFTTLVTDRTRDDVAAHNAKGTYNTDDLNRVTAAMEALHQKLTGYGYATGYTPVTVNHRDGTASTVWRTDDEDVTERKLEAYRANVGKLRAVLPLFASTPELPERMGASSIYGTDGLTVEKANAIERILVDVDAMLARLPVTIRRSAAPGFYADAAPLPTEQIDMGRNWAQLDALGLTWADLDSTTFYLLSFGAWKE